MNDTLAVISKYFMQVHKSSELSPLQEAWETSLNSDLNSHIKKERERKDLNKKENRKWFTHGKTCLWPKSKIIRVVFSLSGGKKKKTLVGKYIKSFVVLLLQMDSVAYLPYWGCKSAFNLGQLTDFWLVSPLPMQDGKKDFIFFLLVLD